MLDVRLSLSMASEAGKSWQLLWTLTLSTRSLSAAYRLCQRRVRTRTHAHMAEAASALPLQNGGNGLTFPQLIFLQF